MFKVVHGYKLILLLLILGVSITACSKSYVINDNDELSKNEGVLCFNIEFFQGATVFSDMTFTLENLERNTYLKIPIDSNSSSTIVYHLKAGTYYFSEIKAKIDEDNERILKNEKSKTMWGSMPENVFIIEPGKVNFIGNIRVNVSSNSTAGESFDLKLPGKRYHVKGYFLSYLSSKAMNKISEAFPNLTQRYPLIKQKLLFHADSLHVKEIYTMKMNTYREAVVSDDQGGWGDYKWGMTIDEVKLLLSEKNQTFSEDTSSNVITQTGKTPIKFHFSKLGIALWKNRLFRVSLFFNQSHSKILEKMTHRYGQSKKAADADTWQWETSSTIYLLKKLSEKKSLLSYISKDHDTFYKQYQKKDEFTYVEDNGIDIKNPLIDDIEKSSEKNEKSKKIEKKTLEKAEKTPKPESKTPMKSKSKTRQKMDKTRSTEKEKPTTTKDKS